MWQLSTWRACVLVADDPFKAWVTGTYLYYYVCDLRGKTAPVHMPQPAVTPDRVSCCCSSLVATVVFIEPMHIQPAAPLTAAAINYMNVKKSGNSNGRWHSGGRNSEKVFQCPHDKREQQWCEQLADAEFICQVRSAQVGSLGACLTRFS